MIGLLLLYYIGKSFHDLADRHDKSKWGFALLGIASYYAGTMIGGVIIGIILLFNSPDGEIDASLPSDILLGLLAVPFGLLACWGLHSMLKKNWEKADLPTFEGDILDEEV